MNRRKILSLASAALTFMVAATITSTVAWYTGSAYLAVTDINIGLFNPELSISVDGEHFSDKVKSKDLMEVKEFTAVSSMFSDEWKALRKDKPIFKDGYASSGRYIVNESTDCSNATGGYFSQEFYLKCDTYAYVTLDREKSGFTPDEAGNQALVDDEAFLARLQSRYPGLTKDEALYRLNNVVKSMRFSILVIDEDGMDDGYDDYKYFIYDQYKGAESELLGGILDTTDSGYYETYNSKEVLFGEVSLNSEDDIIYDAPLEQETTSVTRKDMTCFAANNAAGDRKINFNDSKFEIKREDSFGYDEVETSLLIPCAPGKSQKIVLSFYQEGWDRENTNFIVYSHFLVNVLFKIAPVEPRF